MQIDTILPFGNVLYNLTSTTLTSDFIQGQSVAVPAIQRQYIVKTVSAISPQDT